jgi:hypothetical protein
MVKVYKLTTGEEVIGDVVNDSDSSLELKNPAQIILQRTENGMGLAIAPFMPYSSENVTLYRIAIVSECEPDINLVNEYNKIFGSGIQIAPASALIGL